MEEELWILLEAKANEERVALLFQDPNITTRDPILIKGWSVARFYPDDSPRSYSDIDLAFDPELFGIVNFSAYQFPYLISVDGHFGFRSYDVLPWSTLYERSQLVDLGHTPIRVLADEDNLRITAVHWLTDGGVNRERLWDMYYLVKNRKHDFDWQRCLESNGPIRKTWVLAAIASARDHLELDVSGLPEEAQSFKLPGWYKATLEKEWKRGVYPRRVLSTVVTRPKLLAEQLYRRFPPNKIAATIDTETPIDNTSRLPAQIKSLTHKVMPFARGIGRRLTYSFRREPKS